MTVEVERDALLGAAKQVVGVVASRNTIPVLGNLLLVAEGGQLTITGTDLDLQASAWVVAAGELKTTVESGKLVAAAQSLKPGKVVLELVDGRVLTATQGRAKRTLATIAAADFPVRPPMTGGASFTIAGPSLARLIEATHQAQSTDETRYYLQGVNFDVRDDVLRAAAADGHRAVRATMAVPPGAEDLPAVIVPTKTVAQLRSALAKVEGDVRIALDHPKEPRAIQFEIGATRLLSKVIDGTFPDLDRTIPEDGARRIIVARDGIIEPFEAVAGLVDAEGDKIKVRAVAVDLTGEEFLVQAKDSKGTFAEEPLDLELQGEPIRFGINKAYMVGLAGIFAEDARLTISLEDERSTLRITSDKDPDLIAVVMPMRA